MTNEICGNDFDTGTDISGLRTKAERKLKYAIANLGLAPHIHADSDFLGEGESAA